MFAPQDVNSPNHKALGSKFKQQQNAPNYWVGLFLNVLGGGAGFAFINKPGSALSVSALLILLNILGFFLDLPKGAGILFLVGTLFWYRNLYIRDYSETAHHVNPTPILLKVTVTVLCFIVSIAARILIIFQALYIAGRL
ncbi:hypothetical protein [Deinococcus pimensis]|uniref:hypothetical protein n=1 Tax=Deinococcus pimensis TaxID=309888 RepID=UPI0012F81D62|nr:hypothetical protein [Deinococcus pimensis]